MCLFSTSYFLSKRESDIVKLALYNLKRLFYQKLVKLLSSDKRQSDTQGIHFCHVYGDDWL